MTLILIDLDNKPTWYKDINTSVPTLEYDGKFITDSYQILQYLDETYPDPPLNPPNNKEAEEVTGIKRSLMTFTKYAFGNRCTTLCIWQPKSFVFN